MTNPRPATQTGRRKILLLLTLAAFALLGFAAFRLLLTAFEMGDMYPEYSSLGAELEGTEVLYEALEALPEIRVSRSYVSFTSLRDVKDATVLAPGFRPYAWRAMTKDEAQKLRDIVQGGARIVVAFDAAPLPAFVSAILEGQKKGEKKVEKKVEKKAEQQKPQSGQLGAAPEKEEAREDKSSAIAKILAIRVDYLKAPEEQKGRWRAGTTRAVKIAADAPPQLPERLEWSKGIQLAAEDPSWKIIYQEGDRPAVMERTLGKGSLVVLADSYLLTNRAMWKSRRPEFLLWLLGGRKKIVFDEAHLGVSDNPGIAWLARKYRLHGLFAALIALLALYAWKESASVQAPPHSGPAGLPPGESHAGLVALLKRCIPQSQVLGTCVDEWAKSEKRDPRAVERLRGIVTAAQSASDFDQPPAPAPGGVITRTVEKMKSFARRRLTHRRDPVRAYNEIVRHWKESTR